MPEARPINLDTVLDAAAELRRYAEQPLTYAGLRPTSASFVAALLSIPVGNLLAAAESEGQRRARAIEATVAECDEGTCPVSEEVTRALLEVGPWSEIDGDGDVASVLADHVREMGHWYTLGRKLVAYVERMETGPFDREVAEQLTAARLELADLFNAMATRRPGEPIAEQIARLATFIVENIPGEPSRSEGAVDTAIRLLSRHVGCPAPVGAAGEPCGIVGPCPIHPDPDQPRPGTLEHRPDPPRPGAVVVPPDVPPHPRHVAEPGPVNRDHQGWWLWDGSTEWAENIVNGVRAFGGRATFVDHDDPAERRIRVENGPHGVAVVAPGQILVDDTDETEGAGRWLVKAAK